MCLGLSKREHSRNFRRWRELNALSWSTLLLRTRLKGSFVFIDALLLTGSTSGRQYASLFTLSGCVTALLTDRPSWKNASPNSFLSVSKAAIFVLTVCEMGKPLSRPDCLRQNPPCVGKGEEEEEDLNIEDCYIPQRSIYDTVRLNEQIDSGSKGSLSSRHFTDRTLPYSHRTLDVSSLCSNGALSSSSIFELRGRETSKLDEKMIFDALKLNSDVIRSPGLPKPKSQAEKREYRRSWRMFVPANIMDYANKSESSFVEPSDASDAVAKASKCRWGTNSQTSEEEDSGLCSPPAEKEEKPGIVSGEQPQIRSLSSAEDIHTSEQDRPFFPADSVSEQKIPLLSCRSAHPSDNFQMILQDASPLRGGKCVNGQRSLHGESGYVQNPLRESTKSTALVVPRDGAHKWISSSEDQEKTLRQGESQTTAHSRECREPLVDLHPSTTVCLREQQGDFDSMVLLENVILLAQYDSEESTMVAKGNLEAPFSAQKIDVTQKKSPNQFIHVKKETGPWKTGVQVGSPDTVCNGFQLVQVMNGIEKPC